MTIMTERQRTMGAWWQRHPSDDEMGGAAFLASRLHARVDIDRCKAMLGVLSVLSVRIPDTRIDGFEASAVLFGDIAEAFDDALCALTGLTENEPVPIGARLLIDMHGLTVYARPEMVWSPLARPVVDECGTETRLANEAVQIGEDSAYDTTVVRIVSDWLGMLTDRLGETIPGASCSGAQESARLRQ